MPSIIVVGAQWGDEGKGKVIDLLTADARHIVRAQGGNNAGHTIMIGTEEYKLHLVPSGILHPHTQCYIGAGTVLDPEVLLQEIDGLTKRNITIAGRLWISPAAHVILPYHRIIDRLLETRKGALSVGTTGKGIGPCYSDKAHRLGIRMGDLVRPETFRRLLKDVLDIKNDEIVKLYGGDPLSFDDIYGQYSGFAAKLAPFIAHIEKRIADAISSEENVLFEGAQGTFLDLTSGTYPFVTSSNTVAAGICVGAGIGPNRIDHIVGIVKAYTTRVGNGPMPSEIADGDVFLDHKKAREFGTTTGRKRRIGWFDAVLVQEAARLNGFDSLAITKLDILDDLASIQICTAYELDGKRYDYVPSVIEDLQRVKPIYETLPGWQCSTREAATFDALPKNAKAYLKRIEELCQLPISIISLGPERERTIVLSNLFEKRGAPCRR